MPADFSALEAIGTGGGVEFAVKVVPGASQTRIVGVLGRALKLTVAAAPERGKANDSVIDLIASTLGVKRGDVSIVSGLSRPLKRVAVAGLDVAGLLARLNTT